MTNSARAVGAAGSLTSNPTLRSLIAEFRRTVGKQTLKRIPLALVAGLVTLVIGGQVVSAIAYTLLLAVVVATASFVGLLARDVAKLERALDESRSVVRIQALKASIHIAISDWVSAHDYRPGPTEESEAGQQLLFLSANALNQIRTYEYYPTSLVSQIEEIVSGPDGGSAFERLETLLARLRSNLVTGSYIRP